MKTKGGIIEVVLASILIVAFNVLVFLLVGTDNPLSFSRCFSELNALISQRDETLKFNH